MNRFFHDVLKGLSAPAKYLDSKYFYDKEGDRLFEQIMECEEYYLTNCELEIFSQQSGDLLARVLEVNEAFDVIELGAGNALKSGYFLEALVAKKIPFTYFPIDISENVISSLETDLPERITGLEMQALHGEYLDMLKKACFLSSRKKVVLFLGSNIGNFTKDEAEKFCTEIRKLLTPGDMLLTGFDLAKNPRIILDAYNDKAGITRLFNFNLLHRINRELEADFDTNQFDHFPTYDPHTGVCKSYLVSLADQVVCIGEADFVFFKEGESILTEVCQKYSSQQVKAFAERTGFRLLHDFYDSKKWFVDSLWEAVSI